MSIFEFEQIVNEICGLFRGNQEVLVPKKNETMRTNTFRFKEMKLADVILNIVCVSRVYSIQFANKTNETISLRYFKVSIFTNPISILTLFFCIAGS